MASRTLPPADLARGIRTGNRATLARAITLIESKRADHRKIAHLLVQELLPHTGSAVGCRYCDTLSAPRGPCKGLFMAIARA